MTDKHSKSLLCGLLQQCQVNILQAAVFQNSPVGQGPVCGLNMSGNNSVLTAVQTARQLPDQEHHPQPGRSGLNHLLKTVIELSWRHFSFKWKLFVASAK